MNLKSNLQFLKTCSEIEQTGASEGKNPAYSGCFQFLYMRMPDVIIEMEEVNQVRNRIFLRYVLSYALVLFLPIFLLYFYFDGAIIRRYSEEMTNTDSSMLLQLRDTVDAKFQQLFNLAYVIQNTSSLNPKNIGGDIVARRNAIALLGTYNSIAELPESIIVYRSGDDVCYTGTTAITPEKLFGQQMVYSAHSAEDFFHTVDDANSIIVWPVDSVYQYGGQSSDCLTVFISVGAGNVKPKQRSVFVIPVSRLAGQIRALSGQDASVLVTDREGEAIFSTGEIDLQKLRSERKLEAGRVRLEGGDYYLSETASGFTGWTYTVFRPLEPLEKPLRVYRRNVMLLMVLILLAGGTVIWAVSWNHYKPIRNLAEKARSYAPGSDAGNEMEQVEAVLETLSHESESYRVRLENSAESLRQRCLTRLLSDAGQAQEVLKELRGFSSMTDPDASYRVLVIEKKESLSTSSPQSIREIFLSVSLEVTDVLVCLNPPDRDLLAVILQYSGSAGGLEEEILVFRNRLEEETGQQVSIGVSLELSERELAEGYRQAVSACRMRLIRGRGAVTFYSSDLEPSASLKDYPLQELEALQWHLLQMNTEKVNECLDRIAEKLQKEPVSFELARMVCYDTVNVTVRTLLSMRDRVNPEISSDLIEHLESMVSFDSVEELTGKLKTLIAGACSAASDSGEEKTDQRSETLKQYVRENCFQSDFSLQMAADHFGLTPSNLSHYFKNCTGMGLSEYVQEVRRTEACRLLSETDMAIQEIGRQVGMVNVSSFIRFFKQQTGLTPGQYREKHAGKT